MLKSGLTAGEADAFVKQARANGSIASVQGAAAEYAARKQAAAQSRGQWIEQQEAAEAAFVQQMQAEQERRNAEAQVRQQAFDMARWKQEDYAEGARWEAQQAYQAETKDIPAWRKMLSKLTSIGALALDITSLAISSSGALLETIFTALGLAEPTPGGGEMIGFAASVTLYNTVLNPIENWLSARSAFLVTASDILAGNTRLEQAVPFPGVHATELVIGQDTLVAWGGIAFGNTSLTPEAFTDTVVNAGIVYYDVQRLREQIPDYVSCRIGRTEGGALYFRCLSTGNE